MCALVVVTTHFLIMVLPRRSRTCHPFADCVFFVCVKTSFTTIWKGRALATAAQSDKCGHSHTLMFENALYKYVDLHFSCLVVRVTLSQNSCWKCCWQLIAHLVPLRRWSFWACKPSIWKLRFCFNVLQVLNAPVIHVWLFMFLPIKYYTRHK